MSRRVVETRSCIPAQNPRRWLTRKGKGKKKVSDFGKDRRESDGRESDSEDSGDGSSRAKFASIEKFSTSEYLPLRHRSVPTDPVLDFFS